MSGDERAVPSAMRPNHALALLRGGEQLFPALVKAIDRARSEVLLETYMFEFSGSPLMVAEALERAAARGIVVRVVIDGFGTLDIPADWKTRWEAAGVDWRLFN